MDSVSGTEKLVRAERPALPAEIGWRRIFSARGCRSFFTKGFRGELFSRRERRYFFTHNEGGYRVKFAFCFQVRREVFFSRDRRRMALFATRQRGKTVQRVFSHGNLLVHLIFESL